MYILLFILLAFMMGLLSVMVLAKKKTTRRRRAPKKRKGRKRSSKKTIPLFKIIQGLLVMQELTGGHLDDLLYPVVDALTGKRDVNLLNRVRDTINMSLGYIMNNPAEAITHAAMAAILTSVLARAMQAMGVPKKVDIGFCYIAIR